MAPPPLRATIYVRTVTVLGLLCLGALILINGPQTLTTLSPAEIALAAAIVIGELSPIKMGPGDGEVTPSTSFTFALLISHGVTAAILAHALASLISDVVDRKPADKTAFNIAQNVLAIGAAALVLTSLTTFSTPIHFGIDAVPALLLGAVTFFAINTLLVAAAISLHAGVSLRGQLSSDLIFHSGTEAILLGMAPLAVLAIDYSPVLVPLVGLPLIAAHRAGRHAVLSEKLALTDALTGLPNRVLFRDRTDQAISAARREGERVGVMMIDLDRFKEVNDTLGHHIGDEVLRQVAQRLRETLRDSDTVARLGGDEFAVLLTPGSPEDAEAIAGKLRDAIASPVEAAGIRFPLSASIGIAWFPAHGDDVDGLMQRADVAMYQAKSSAAGVDLYAEERDDNSVRRLTMAGALSRAIDDEEVEVRFQPQLDARDGRMIGAEALARWNYANTWIAPDEFIEVAERTGLIVPLTLHVVREAVAQLARWRTDNADLTISVNLSARALAQPDLPERVAAICAAGGVSPSLLVLEITESMAIADPEITVPVVHRLAAMGATISIDDFGMGFSSLASLKSLPVGELKIDRSFVARMNDDPQDAAIVRCAIDLAHSLGMRVVAEGVENVEAQLLLTGLGCDLMQGFLFGRAVPGAQLTVSRTAARTRAAA